MQACLRRVYTELYVPYASGNALHAPNTPIACPLFVDGLDRYCT